MLTMGERFTAIICSMVGVTGNVGLAIEKEQAPDVTSAIMFISDAFAFADLRAVAELPRELDYTCMS